MSAQAVLDELHRREGQLDASRRRERELVGALEKIASCESYFEGDVVAVARTAVQAWEAA
jgi:hypothetical protein